MPPMSDPLWAPVDPGAWQSVPHVKGRLATADDVKAGRAVFYLDVEASHAAPHEMALPACGIQILDDDRREPVIVIQAEALKGETIVGVRYLKGGGGVCYATEVELLPAPDERFAP